MGTPLFSPPGCCVFQRTLQADLTPWCPGHLHPGNRHSEPNPGLKVEGSEQALNASVLSSHGPTLPVPDRASSL